MQSNYLETENPWHLPKPPEWWLQALLDQDIELVVFPSRMRMAYILARRRRFSNAMETLNRLDKNMLRQSAGMDGDILATHNLIYVRHLLGNTVRRPEIFQWLRDHDVQANGGAEKVSNKIEIVEEENAARVMRKIREDIDFRARDAWRSYQARTGRRSGAGTKSRGATQMPVTGFTPHESALASFVRD